MTYFKQLSNMYAGYIILQLIQIYMSNWLDFWLFTDDKIEFQSGFASKWLICMHEQRP